MHAPLPVDLQRRTVLPGALAFALAGAGLQAFAARAAEPTTVDQRWYDAALEVKRLAESWGDQPYGAVLVLGGHIVGYGPSRVVKDRNPDAHAEREALRDARRRLGRERLDGSTLVSTSRPCRVCEQAAAQAGVTRMIHGAALADAGAPVP